MRIDFFSGCVVGALFGFAAGLLATVATDENPGLIAECQKQLPRSQHCVLVAVPKQERNQ